MFSRALYTSRYTIQYVDVYMYSTVYVDVYVYMYSTAYVLHIYAEDAQYVYPCSYHMLYHIYHIIFTILIINCGNFLFL